MVKGKGRRPKKEITLPRLKLMVVTIGVRAANFITRVEDPLFKMNNLDGSTCVLYWFRTDKPLSLFVENSVQPPQPILQEVET